jgi:hypothetical protein
MAKRKTPKAEKIVDLKPRAEKVTDEQLNRLQTTIKTIEHFTNDIGRLEIQKNTILSNLRIHQEKVEVLSKEFTTQYGTNEINIQDGTIVYPSEKSNENGETDKED